MKSQFDMNQPPRICGICAEVHPIHNPCKYDRLVKVIHTQKQQIISMLQGNRELFKTATSFQNIIKEMTPRLEAAHIFKTAFDKVMSNKTVGEANDIYSEIEAEIKNGTTDIQAETSQLSFKEIQPETTNPEHVRPSLGSVPPEIPSPQP